ncbi:MAG: SPASM domain-containing protein, partial [Candidatus Margulisiibacteriota bacterium]
RLATEIGVDTVNYRLTKPLGKAKDIPTQVTYEDLDRFLLDFIDARVLHPRDQIKLLLSSATFGPNYYSRGMLRYQLGLDSDPYFSSKYPCPLADSEKSYAVLLPSEKFIFCPTLVGEKTDGLITGNPQTGEVLANHVLREHLAFPSEICRPCDVLDICRGGCVASRLQGNGLASIKKTNLDICMTEALRRWESNLK